MTPCLSFVRSLHDTVESPIHPTFPTREKDLNSPQYIELGTDISREEEKELWGFYSAACGAPMINRRSDKAATRVIPIDNDCSTFAFKGSGIGLWDWNVATNKVIFSDGWKDLFGYAQDEIGDNLNLRFPVACYGDNLF